MVDIYLRDINGREDTITIGWHNVCQYVDQNREILEDEEILLIMFNDACIYSQLANGPINWGDVVGFFA